MAMCIVRLQGSIMTGIKQIEMRLHELSSRIVHLVARVERLEEELRDAKDK